MATLVDVIADIRAAVDREGTDVQITDAQLTAWVNTEYQAVRRRLAGMFPSLYEVVSADVVVAAGVATFDIAGAPLSLANVGKLGSVQRKESASYITLRYAHDYDPELSPYLCWRQRGATAVDIFPVLSAPGTYRVRYMSKPAVLSGSGAVDLPDGGERVLVEAVAVRCRVKWEEDPSAHAASRAGAWAELVAGLSVPNPLTPHTVQDVTGRW